MAERRKIEPSAPGWVEHAVAPEEAGLTVQEILTGPLGVSRRMIQRLTRSGGIRLNRRPAFLARRVRAGDVVSARVRQAERPALPPAALPLAVVHEDADLLVVDKPPHVLVHPTRPEQVDTLAHRVAHRLAARGVAAKVRPVHRLDRDTSGLVVFALTAYTHQHLDRQLRERTLERGYLALVQGAVADHEGTIEAPIGRHPRHQHLRAVRPGGDPAVTRYRTVERLPGATLLSLSLETGRTHQIRVHLAHAGHPVLGDRPYGGRPVPGLGRQALHAHRLALHHPLTGAPLSFESPLPDDLGAVLASLRG